MTVRFDYFVILAEMRTGSNLLEAHLNSVSGLQCHGEAFNPSFIGFPKTDQIAGITRAARDADPKRLLHAIRDEAGELSGFRYFHDHDPRILDTVLDDPRAAKIILTRNPLDSYVSLKIARATGQWKLTNVKQRKHAQAQFDRSEFEAHLSTLQGFQRRVQHRLQSLGQTAFYISYDDLGDSDVLSGLLRFLGATGAIDLQDAGLKPQNPGDLREKVSNYDEMMRALRAIDAFDLGRTPEFEPRRGAAVPGFVTGAHASLLYMPIRSGPEAQVRKWLAALDGVEAADLPSPGNQKALRQWKRRKTGHRSFTVLRHPVARAHSAFCHKILAIGPGTYSEIRRNLRNFFKIPLQGSIDETYTAEAHRAAFLGFLGFLKQNLSGQTNVRVDAHWASQAAILQGMSQFGCPDLVLREDEMAKGLPALAQQVGYATPPAPDVEKGSEVIPLERIYDQDIEDLAADVYQRDYMMFGFGPWRG